MTAPKAPGAVVRAPQSVSHAHDVPHELIQKYDRPGPRYTSYPTAPEWHDLSHADAHAAYSRIADDPRPVSLYVHVPFCERMCLFCGCNVVVARSHDKIPRYLDALEREIGLIRAACGHKPVVQLHFGGGTPTFLTPEELVRIGKALWAAFTPLAGAEVGIEIDPMVTTQAHLEAARGLGFNRLSLGVQDFQDDVQRITERNQPDAKTTEVFELGRSLGFASINLDLMYGLPGQTPGHLAHSARRAVELGADRVAAFGYAHVPWMKPHQRKLEKYGIPTAEERWAMFNAARSTLLEAGYQAIGMDHFAKPTDELALAFKKRRLNRNFQGYTVLDPTHLIALGPTAISEVGGVYLQNAKRLSSYYGDIEAGRFATEKGTVLSADDHLRRAVITAIMCNLYVDFAEIEKHFSINFRKHFYRELAELEGLVADGLVVRHDGGIEVTERGRVFVRNVAMTFDVYLKRAKDSATPRFSRTV